VRGPVIAAFADPGPTHELVFLATPVVAFAAWGYLPCREQSLAARAAFLLLCSVVVMVSVVLAQLSGTHEPVMFEVSILALVIGRWWWSSRIPTAPSTRPAPSATFSWSRSW
jgi:hypothetical protein